jgi:hypothetical protein
VGSGPVLSLAPQAPSALAHETTAGPMGRRRGYRGARPLPGE